MTRADLKTPDYEKFPTNEKDMTPLQKHVKRCWPTMSISDRFFAMMDLSEEKYGKTCSDEEIRKTWISFANFPGKKNRKK